MPSCSSTSRRAFRSSSKRLDLTQIPKGAAVEAGCLKMLQGFALMFEGRPGQRSEMSTRMLGALGSRSRWLVARAEMSTRSTT